MKKALVTGSSRGIGAAAARATGRGRLARHDKLSELPRAGARPWPPSWARRPYAATSRTAPRCARCSSAWGGVNLLVSNAGIAWSGLLSDMTDAEVGAHSLRQPRRGLPTAAARRYRTWCVRRRAASSASQASSACTAGAARRPIRPRRARSSPSSRASRRSSGPSGIRGERRRSRRGGHGHAQLLQRRGKGRHDRGHLPSAAWAGRRTSPARYASSPATRRGM